MIRWQDVFVNGVLLCLNAVPFISPVLCGRFQDFFFLRLLSVFQFERIVHSRHLFVGVFLFFDDLLFCPVVCFLVCVLCLISLLILYLLSLRLILGLVSFLVRGLLIFGLIGLLVGGFLIFGLISFLIRSLLVSLLVRGSFLLLFRGLL